MLRVLKWNFHFVHLLGVLWRRKRSHDHFVHMLRVLKWNFHFVHLLGVLQGLRWRSYTYGLGAWANGLRTAEVIGMRRGWREVRWRKKRYLLLALWGNALSRRFANLLTEALGAIDVIIINTDTTSTV